MDFPTITARPISDELVRLQPKGLITIPKKFRDSLGFKDSDFVRIKKENIRLILEPIRILPYPVRSYTQAELQSFLDLDQKETKKLKARRILK